MDNSNSIHARALDAAGAIEPLEDEEDEKDSMPSDFKSGGIQKLFWQFCNPF